MDGISNNAMIIAIVSSVIGAIVGGIVTRMNIESARKTFNLAYHAIAPICLIYLFAMQPISKLWVLGVVLNMITITASIDLWISKRR